MTAQSVKRRPGRPERPIDPAGNPAAAAFAYRLRDIRPPEMTYDRMSQLTHFSVPTLAAAAAGREVPSWPVTQAYLEACGVPAAEWDDWREVRAFAEREHKAGKKRKRNGV